MKKLVKQAKPDIIVSTFPTPALSLLKDKKIPIVNIITDYHFHKSWLTKDAVRYYVATDETERELLKLNVEKQRVKKFGIPIAEKFDNKMDVEQWLEDNELAIDKETVLLSAGAFGVSTDFSKLIGKILLKNKDTQVVVICGKNRELKNELEIDYAKQERAKILGYTENMREWMQAADVLITKAGGVTISEALAANEAENPQIRVALLAGDRSVRFIIENTRKKEELNPSILSQKGYSTKGKHSGLGLATLEDMVFHYDLNLDTQLGETTFRQDLELPFKDEERGGEE